MDHKNLIQWILVKLQRAIKIIVWWEYKAPPSSDNSFNLEINYFDNARILVKLDGNYLKQKRNIYTSTSGK